MPLALELCHFFLLTLILILFLDTMKNKTTISLDRDGIIVLAMALRSLSTLRLDLDLSFKNEYPCSETNDFMNELANGIKDLCHALDHVVDDPSATISRLIGSLDLNAGEDVYQFFREELKSINQE